MMQLTRKKRIYAFLTIFLSAIISISAYHLWGTDWRVPISGYRSDSLGVLLELKNYVRGGSVHHFVIYGEPYADLYVDSFGDSSVPMPLLKLIWKITGSVEEAINIHAILNSVLLSLSMFWVCTCLRIKNFSSMLVGVVYGNISYFILGCNTVLLIYGACFYIPLFCYILIELMRSDSHLDKLESGTLFFSLVVMLYVGMNSAYYAFLGMILLAFVMMYALFAKKSVNSILLAFLSFFAIGLGIASYTLSKILKSVGMDSIVLQMGYWLQFLVVFISIVILLGVVLLLKRICKYITMKKIYVSFLAFVGIAGCVYVLLWKYTDYVGSYAGRSLVDVQLGSLKAGSMILPAVNSAFGIGKSILGAITDINNPQAAECAIIGVLAGIGFIYSIIMVFQYKGREYDQKDEVLKICGLIHCFILVVAVKGGLSLLIGAFITTGIRGYSRMCVFIATFGLISSAILIDKIVDRIGNVIKPIYRKGLYILASGVLVFVLLASIPTDFIYRNILGFVAYEQRKKEYDEWYRYMGVIEEQVPDNSMILELPLHIEDVHKGKLMTVGRAYELSIPSVVSQTTYWNDGGKQRNIFDKLLNEQENVSDFLTMAGAYGYKGIYLDKMMYHNDSYLEILNELEQYLGKPIVCSDERRYFYSLVKYNQKLYEKYSDKELIEICERIAEQL